MSDGECNNQNNVYNIVQIVFTIIPGIWAIFCEVMGYLKSKERVKVACVGDCLRAVMKNKDDPDDYAKPQPLGNVSYLSDI